MVIKDKFSLLKNTLNVLNLSSSKINSISVDLGPRKIFVNLEQIRNRIDHFAKNNVFSLISNIKERQKIHVVNYPDYILPISYNKPTKGIVINLSYFNIDDIYPSKPGERNIYSCMVYGICFSELVSGKKSVNDRYSSVFSNFLNSIFIRIFGKQFGLLGTFSSELPKLKFLINCYVLEAFFGLSGEKMYKRSAIAASFNYKDIVEEMKKYDFSDIDGLIKSLSEMHVMPGINKHLFTARMLRTFGISFLPALEDLSRLVSIMSASLPGVNVVPSYIFRYDETDFNKIIDVSKNIFR